MAVLFISDQWEKLSLRGKDYNSRRYKSVLSQAEYDLQHPLIWDQKAFNPLLIRARKNQARLFNALVAWKLTRRSEFFASALSCIWALDEWPQWSSAAFPSDNRDPNGFFELSYGENSFTLAVGIDVLLPHLSDSDRKRVIDIAKRRALNPFLIRTAPGKRSFWFGCEDSNWNAVCCGGVAMLALVAEPWFPKSSVILKRAELSLKPLLKYLERNDGGWPEGLGYWNYCMRYLFHFLLSWQTAKSIPHPSLQSSAIRKTLEFPLCFAPNGVSAGFGDVNKWVPLPVQLALAIQLGVDDVAQELIRRLRTATFSNHWPNDAELLSLNYDGKRVTASRQKGIVAKRLRGLDWMVLSNKAFAPDFYVSIRGGYMPLSHGHLDLLSFNLLSEGSLLLGNIPLTEYQANTFGNRRWEIPDLNPGYKNSLLINGIGPQMSSQVETVSLANSKGERGYSLIATKAYDYEENKSFVGRAFWLTVNRELLIVDHLRLPHEGRVETRWHSPELIRARNSQAHIHAKNVSLHLSFGASVPCTLHPLRLPALDPALPYQSLRWVTASRAPQEILLYTLISPRPLKCPPSHTQSSDHITIAWNDTKMTLGQDLRSMEE